MDEQTKKEFEHQLNVMEIASLACSDKIWNCFREIIKDPELTQNNKFGTCLLAVAGSLVRLGALLGKMKNEAPADLGQVIGHMLHIYDKFDIEISEKEKGNDE